MWRVQGVWERRRSIFVQAQLRGSARTLDSRASSLAMAPADICSENCRSALTRVGLSVASASSRARTCTAFGSSAGVAVKIAPKFKSEA